MAAILKNGGRSPKLRRTSGLYYIPAIVASVAIALFAGYADWQKSRNSAEAEKAVVTEQLNMSKTRLEGFIEKSVAMMQGITQDIATHPNLGQDHLASLTSDLLAANPQIRNIAIAPDLKVTLVYPFIGNEKVIGLDYNKNAAQKAAALHVRDTGQVLVTGPVKLVQGGTGLIARFPVFTTYTDGARNFWGIVSSVLDLEEIYRASGLRVADPDIRIAILSRTPDGIASEPFFGNAQVLRSHPVMTSIDLGFDRWELYAIPKAGWGATEDITGFRLGLLAIAVLLLAPLVWAGKLMSDRQEHVVALQDREDQLTELSHRLELALRTSGIGVWELDVSDNKLSWDSRMRIMYDVPSEQESCGYEDWVRALHPDDLKEAQDVFAKAIRGEAEYSTSFRVVSRAGAVRHIRAMGTVYQDSAGHRKIIGVNWDVTADVRLQDDLLKAKREAEIHNSHLEQARVAMENAALHDALTGLANRRYLDQRLQTIPAGKHVTVLHIDLDRFKEINDTFGHAAGDLILQEAARNLRALIYEGDFLARIGGDEFVVISSPENEAKDYACLAASLVHAMSRPVIYEGHECRIGSSIGFASGNTKNEPANQILINADIALYEAKRKGRNRVEPFTERLRQVAINNKRIADDILRAFEQDQFIAYYQPQFDANTLEINGFEALIRWDHPEKGILAPDTFLRIAENLKVVSTIDAVVLNQAHAQFIRMQANGIDIPKFSVNLSAQRLKEEAFFDKLKEIYFKPGSLSVELLESISFEGDDDELLKRANRLRDMGVDIEIDDFGTGHASILTLLKLMPRRLKIDRQLVFPIVKSATQRALVRSIVDIGRSRNIEIIAEGVETMEHAEILRDLGCHSLQGYAFARPMPGTDFLKFAKEKAWLRQTNQASVVAKRPAV